MKILGVQLCSCCKSNPPRPGQGYCVKCHAWITRCKRKKYRDLTSEEKMKADARSHASTAVRRGQIARQPCDVCGARAEKHHEDYFKPLQIRWLCRAHHLQLHGAASHQYDENNRPIDAEPGRP